MDVFLDSADLCFKFKSGHRYNQRQIKQLFNNDIGNADIGFEENYVHLSGFFLPHMHLVDVDFLIAQK